MLAHDLALALDPAILFRRATGHEPDPWQAELLRSRPQRSLLLCTRQAGKSITTAAVAVHEAIYHAPALVLLLAPALRQSQELFKKVADHYNQLDQPVPVESATALQMRLSNGSRIVALPGKEQTIRGFSGVSLLVVDEAARVPDELYYAIRPMLAVSGGRLLALSTPFGKRGFFHEEWTGGAGAWERVKVTAHDCPRISPEFLEEERRALGPYWFDQEYLCEFRDTVDQVFSYDVVMAAMSEEIAPLW
jgi:hypothetical protein